MAAAVLGGLALLVQVACPAADAAAAEATPSACGLPLCGTALSARLYCIERFESGHDGGAFNRRSGAAGWLQWLPGTARHWGVVVGDRWSEWAAAARIAAYGEAFFRSQWVPLQLGWC